MSMKLSDEIIQTAACSATNGQFALQQDVISALKCGVWAAKYGCKIPLPPLLDIWKMLKTPYYLVNAQVRSCKKTEMIEDYDNWLTDFCSTIRQYFRKKEWGCCLPFLMNLWLSFSEENGNCNDWLKAYVVLLSNNNKINQIYKNWNGGRNHNVDLWKEWWQNNKMTSGELVKKSGIMWSRFSQKISDLSCTGFEHTTTQGALSIDVAPAIDEHLFEKFDSRAAEFYLSAEDFYPSPDQIHRIKQLMKRWQEDINPEIEAYEIITHIFGAITISTLCSGDYGEFKIINRSDPRISNPPNMLRKPDVHIHLCWGTGFKGIHTTTNNNGDNNFASTLQGLVGLIMDDWRERLRGLPIKFHLHRSFPEPMHSYIGKGGYRWNRMNCKFPLPPSIVIKNLFRRSTCTDYYNDVGCTDDPEKNYLYFGWWCECILECDLEEERGFQRKFDKNNRISPDAPIWIKDISKGKSEFPEYIKHMIIIGSPEADWGIYEVARQHNHIELIPKETNKDEDPSFKNLRSSALDLLLNIVEIYLR